MPAHPVFDRIRTDLADALRTGRLSMPELGEAIGAAARKEAKGLPGHSADRDAIRRLAWLVFARAPSLNPSWVAVGPMQLGMLGGGQLTVDELLDALIALEDAATDATGLNTLHDASGEALDVLLDDVASPDKAEDKLSDLVDSLRAKARAAVESGRWEDVPLSGPDAERVRAALAELPRNDAIDIYDAWLRAGAEAEQGKWDDAIAFMNRAIELEPNLFESYVRRARFRFGKNDRYGGGADVEKALSLESHSAVARAMRAELRALIKDIEGSLSDWKAASDAAPGHAGYRLAIGHTYLAQGKLDDALRAFSQAHELAPDDTTPLYNRADIHMRKGNLAAAIADYSHVLKIDESDIQALLNRGTAYLRQRDGAKAEADFTAAVDKEPTNPIVWAKRAVSFLGVGQAWKGWLDALTALGLAKVDWEHYEQVEGLLHGAKRALTGAEGADPIEADVTERFNHLRGRIEPAQSLRLADLLGEHLPTEGIGYHIERGRTYLDHSKWSEARDAFRDALAVNDEHPVALTGKARALIGLNQPAEAAPLLAKAAANAESLPDADRFELHLAQGRVAGTAQNLDAAIAAFEAALAIKPERADVWFYQGVHLDLAGRKEDALAAYTHSVERDPGFAPAWFNRACEAAVLGHKDDALESLRRAAQIEPKWAQEAKTDAYFETLRGDAEFEGLVEAFGG